MQTSRRNRISHHSWVNARNLAGLCNPDAAAEADLEAVEISQRAAEAGDAEAQNDLAFLLENGKGTAPDGEAAFAWYRKAAAQGYQNAIDHIPKLLSQIVKETA